MVKTLLIALLAVVNDATPDARSLLNEAGERLRGMTNFSLVVEQRAFNPGRNMKTTTFKVDRAPGGKVRIDSSAGPLLVSDGKRFWRYDRRLNRYSEETDPEGIVAQTIRISLQRYVERVDLLRLHAGRIRFVKWDEARSARKGERCAVLELLSPDGGGQWTSRLWVDPLTKLVLRLDMERIDGVTEYGEMRKRPREVKTSGFLTRVVQENHLYWQALEGPPDAAFVFEPPPKAQRVAPPPVPQADPSVLEPLPPEQ